MDWLQDVHDPSEFMRELKQASRQYKNPIEPVKNKIEIETQHQIPEIPLTGSMRKVFQGSFYERVTAAFYGGNLTDQK